MTLRMAQATTRTTPRFDTATITPVGWLALTLVAVTGLLHLAAGVVEGRIPVFLAGVGFLVAAILYLADYRRRTLVLLAIPYTAIQLPLWYVANAGEFTALGYLDKAVQVALLLVLVVLARGHRNTG